MQPIDHQELYKNTLYLLGWQDRQWNRKAEGLRLHLGSGHLHLENYVNVDPYTPESDCKDDMQELHFPSGSAVEIVCQHALEHIHIRDVWKTLNHWYDILAPGGTLEVGMPDIELCAQGFLEAPESERWGRYIWAIYGAQSEAFGKKSSGLRGDIPFAEGQIHTGGFTLGVFVRMLEDIGFKMIEAFNYDGHNTPSFFVYAKKPDPSTYSRLPDILEKDVAIGTFSNSTTYIADLWGSAQKQFPWIPFYTRFQRGKINTGMSLLRDDFVASGKRFWCFLDDDIQFLHPDTISNALKVLVNGKYGGVSVYSTFDKNSLTRPYDKSVSKSLIQRSLKWMVGYFVMIDSHKVGDISPDMSLPDGNTSVDTSFSVSIRARGYDIAISPDYVYHVAKNTMADQNVIKTTNEYLIKKWGNFYYDVAQYDYTVLEWQENQPYV